MRLDTPLTALEVSALSQEVFAHLGLSTVGDLVAVDAHTYLDAAEALADGRRAPPALNEVKHILANSGLHLARVIPLGSYDACWQALLGAALAAGHRAERTEEGVRVRFDGAGTIHCTPSHERDDIWLFWEAVESRPALVRASRALTKAAWR